MKTEDRVRAAGRARMDLVGDVRPLELPAELAPRVRQHRSTTAGSAGVLPSLPRRLSPPWL